MKKTSKKKSLKDAFLELEFLPANIVIFKLDDEIFGEKIKYDKEELNLLGNLRDDITIMKKDINMIKTDVKEMRNEMNEKFEEINGKFGQFDKYFKLIAKKLDIKLDEENKSENKEKNTEEKIKDNDSK